MKPIELLLTKLLNCSYMDLYLEGISLSDNQKKVLEEMLVDYIDGRPVQYILGESEFMGLTFKVKEGVFIPRPETEILIEEAVNIVKGFNGRAVKLLDLGTGSGCIAVSLAKLLPDCRITAVDISDTALETARKNAREHNVADSIEFLKSDLFSGLGNSAFDIIVSNPPYIPTQEINNLSIQVKSEPRNTLDGASDGFGFYRRIIKDAPQFLKQSGYLIFEIGDGQAQGIKDILERAEAFQVLDIIRDYNSIERVLVTRKL